MGVCSNCGTDTVESARFCHYCGAVIRAEANGTSSGFTSRGPGTLLGLPLPPSTPVAADSDGPAEETATFAASGPVFADGKRWNAYVTPSRVVLWREVGLISPKKVTQEIDPAHLTTVEMYDEGSILKEYFLMLDGTTLKGRRSDIENIHRGVQAIRNGSDTRT